MRGVLLSPLKKIKHDKGDLFHGIKMSDVGFESFGEAYFTSVLFNETKGWKKHHKMVLNLIVPVGDIEVRVFDDGKEKQGVFTIGVSNYQRLTIQPGLWVSFKGLDKGLNLMLNVASIEHDPLDSVNADLSLFENMFL